MDFGILYVELDSLQQLALQNFVEKPRKSVKIPLDLGRFDKELFHACNERWPVGNILSRP